ncbi:MAG TPA: aminotransferase class III-fold pyridoxal phosphate-dependent enzyme [Anaerolineae bacterium]|nr:aminotransferase class III-fold pyridoxal phosphate-dependent enzyme [Anaerolineae bacterium]
MMLPATTEHLSPVWARYSNVLVDHAEGAYIYAADGSRYLDFTCGIGVTNTGHCHPKVVSAAQEQVGKLIHGQANIVYHKPMLDLVEQLLTVVPPSLDTFFFSNSGAEAIEASVKLARAATGRPNIITFQGGFHGRTNATMALTSSKAMYRSNYAPLMSGVHIVPFPYAYRLGMDSDEAVDFCLDEIEYMFATQTAPDQVAGILIEPVLGEGGYVVPPDGFLQGLRAICDQYGILLIADEVQSGFGRTGKWFGHQHFDTTPDIMVMAKGIASGFPLSGIAARKDLMTKWAAGSHGGTYGGNAVACAAGAATIRAMKDEAMVENAAKMGPVLLGGLRDIQEEFPIIGDVRGIGLMAATEFTHPSGDWHESKKVANAVRQKCLDDGKLMLLTCGPFDNVVRWIPPLIVNEEQINDALGVFKNALQSVAA